MSGRLRNRIVGEGEEVPDQLLANPRNWRIHPFTQQQALTEVLERVGWVQRVIVNQRTGFVVDGHMRVSIAISRDEPTIPVEYVDLSEEEEALVLATFDPISTLAGPDANALNELLGGLEADGTIGELLSAIGDASGLPDMTLGGLAPNEKNEGIEDDVEFIQCPSCSHRWPK